MQKTTELLLLALTTIIVLSALPTYAQNETTDAQLGSSDALTPTPCQARFIKHDCHRFIKSQDKEIQKLVNKCDGDSSSYIDIASSCAKNAGGVWKEAAKDLAKFLEQPVQNLISTVGRNLDKQAKPKVKIYQWRVNCKKKIECISKLIQASEIKKIPEQEASRRAREVMGSWRSWQLFNFYFNKAVHLNGFGGHKNPWYTNEMQKLFPASRKPKTRTNAFSKLKDHVYKKWDKLYCLNSEGQAAMLCYGIATIVDPIIAAKLLKVTKLAKIKESLEKTSSTRRRSSNIDPRPQWPKAQSQKAMVSALRGKNDTKLVEAMAALRTEKQQIAFIEQLSDDDFIKFSKKVYGHDYLVNPLIDANNIAKARTHILSNANRLNRKFETISRSYFARQNRLLKRGPPKGEVKYSPRSKEMISDELEYYDSNGKSRGFLQYEFKKNKNDLYVHSREVPVEDAGREIQSELFKEALKRNPKTKTVSSLYVSSNRMAVDQALKRGANCTQAIMNTPAYRIAAKHGFKKVLYAACESLGDSITEATFGK